MLNYLIIILFVVNITFIYKWYVQRAHNKQLFNRAWQLEFTLMDIYDNCSDEVKKKILHTLNNINPL